ncbi:MAG: redoxin domain-containing protein [Bacteroidota bacterium]
MHAPNRFLPDFALPVANPWVDHIDGPTRALSDYARADLLVLCFLSLDGEQVRRAEAALRGCISRYVRRGVRFLAVNAFDVAVDAKRCFAMMEERATRGVYPFPYLFDAQQQLARACGVQVVPDVLIADADRRICYQGRADGSCLDAMVPSDGVELCQALDDLLKLGRLSRPVHHAHGIPMRWLPEAERLRSRTDRLRRSSLPDRVPVMVRPSADER